MIIGSHDTAKRVLIIAEVGNNHEGDFGLAKELVLRAAQSGADAVKFQTIVPERLISPAETDRIKHFSRFQFTYDQFAELAELAEKHGVIFFSTPFDLDSAKFLNTIVPAFKIASGDNTFYPLIQTIAETGKPIIMSTGLAGTKDIDKAVSLIRHVWRENGANPPGLALLHCLAAYPTPDKEANLAAIGSFTKWKAVPGYSDHTLGIEAAVLSVACGARIIEKHFTIDKNHSDFRDHQLSADPSELAEMVCRVRLAESMLGSPELTVSACEKEGKPLFRRSIIATTAINTGTTVMMEHLTWVRPGGGLEPGRENELIGKKTTRDIANGERITLTDVA